MKLSLVDTLISEGLIDDRQLEECREIEKDSGQPIDRVLKNKGYISEETLLDILARSLRLPFQDDLEGIEVPKVFTQKVPAQFARAYNLVCINSDENGFDVATCDPLDFHPMDISRRCSVPR
ncbi:MAG: hypothetical protein VX496_08335 [Planctomycetota bacterium]|nr:hypothetical protein [Planctomycetota bacterium]